MRKIFTAKIAVTALLGSLFLLCVVFGLSALQRTAHAEESETQPPVEITDVSWGLEKYEVYYTGEFQTPKVIINKPVLKEHTDYEVSYSDNVNAGTATVTLTLMGKYSGEFQKTFTILPREEYFTVSWQYYSGGWKALTDFENTFVYRPATGSSGYIRAVLTANKDLEHVYAEGVAAAQSDAYRNENMSLRFTSGGEQAEFKNAAEYSVTIEGTGNYALPEEDRTVTVTISPARLGISESDFANYIDNDGNRLWLLSYGDGKTSGLMDTAIYFDPDAEQNEYKDCVTEGTAPDSYALYNGSALDLVLNGDYIFSDGVKLSDYLASAECSYAHVNKDESAGTTGRAREVHEITTTVILNFNPNFKGEKKIEVTKTWYIVTVNNELRGESGEMVSGSRLDDRKFGTDVEMKLRPEHGDTVVFTYRKTGLEEISLQYAVDYSDDTSTAKVKYYEVKTDENGKPVPDKNKPISEEDHHTALALLEAREYRVTVYVPQFEVQSPNTHTHWWEDSGATHEKCRVFYEITRTFELNVSKYTINKSDAALSISFSSKSVVYNGKENNTPRLLIELNGRQLKEGVDYKLESNLVGVGTASLTVVGIGSLDGEIVYADSYDVIQAANTWSVVPGVMNWTYGDYQKQINLISAEATYLDDPEDLWFKITTDADGQNVVAGLEHFYLDEEGFVSDDAEKILSSLSAAEYYLFAVVEGNENYTGLAPAGVEFRIFKATNYWEIAPDISDSWVKGKYDETVNKVLSQAHFGNGSVVIVITDSKDNVVYDSEKGVNDLKKAPAGLYLITAAVAGTDDYTDLTYTSYFRIFSPGGIAWWGTLLVVIGVLLTIALVIFILHRRGVLHLLSDKMIAAIRTREAVDATIAAVRANKAAAEAKLSRAEMQARDREQTQISVTAEAPVSGTAAELEARAAAIERRARALGANAENLRKKASAIRENASETNKTEE